jgi:hypothetical protein
MADDSLIYGSGNIKFDQKWLQRAEDAGMLEVIDPDSPDAPPDGARMRFNGDPNAEGSPWVIPPEGGRCRGKAYLRDGEGNYVYDEKGRRIRRPCLNWPIKGGPVCIPHGGGVPRVLAAAKMRLLESADVVTAALVKMATDNTIDPKARIQACNSILDRIGVKAGVDVTVEVKPWQDLLQKLERGQ